MGSSDPPYLYDRPTRPVSFPYSHFDPKAASRASWQQSIASSRPQTARTGPLIDFNRHPDSYMVVRGSQEVPSLPGNTKRAVTAVRWIQFSLRVLQLVAAMGMLFCAITLKLPEQTQSWIMRITPGYDMLITLYSIYHLLRSSKHRTPSSSASYHVFALVMDTGLIPLYTFIAIFNNSKNVSFEGTNAWTSMFRSLGDTQLIVLIGFYFACSLAGLHFLSMGLDLYLVVIFRKIAKMPPDMNPLEDNLTGRKSSKHKYKNSELSLVSTIDEKSPAENFEVPSPHRHSERRDTASPSRQVPFGHSRAPSDLAFSPHNPRSAQLSRQYFGASSPYQQPASARQSTQSFVTANSSLANLPSTQHIRKSGRQNPDGQKKLLNDNWYVVDDDISANRLDAMSEDVYAGREPRLPELDNAGNTKDFVHQPLRMNPPTPTIEQQKGRGRQWQGSEDNRQDRLALGEVSVNRTPTVTSNATVTSSVYSESAPSLTAESKPRGSPRKFYGDLTAAARGIRGYTSVPQHDSVPDKAGLPTTNSNNTTGGRVLSRSGVDIADEMIVPEKSSRRRLFSGKRAEEGMAGLWR